MPTVTAPSRPSSTRPTWLRHPQRVFLRRALFQIHLWLGLLLTLYAVVIGLSGAALVFRPELEQHLRPALFHIDPRSPRLPLTPILSAVTADRPGWIVTGLEDLDQPTEATTLLLRRADGTLSGNYRLVSVDPTTGRVLHDTLRFAGPLGFATNLHFYLCTGKTGLLVSGWAALGLVLLALTGLVLWWPGLARWRSALLFRPRVRLRRLIWELHTVVGFWTLPVFPLLCLPGLYFSFPQPVPTFTLALTASHPAPSSKSANPTESPAPLLTVDQALAHARALLPANAQPSYFSLPAHPGAPLYTTGYVTGAAPFSQLISLTLDPHTGAPLARTDTRDLPRGNRLIQLFFALHFGTFAGPGPLGTLVKLLWVLAGVTPALLALTGALMFYNRKLRRHLSRREAPAPL